MSDTTDINSFNGHTIMLVQFSSNEETRTYVDCRTPNDALESFCRIYENFLLHKNGHINPSEGGTDATGKEETKKVEY
jgi:hypothetical protein